MICLCLVYAFSSLLLSLCFVRPHHTSCGILVPWPGMEPVPPAVEVHSPLSLQEIPMVFTYYSGTSWLCSGNARCSILGNHFFISVTKFSSTIPSYPLSSFFSRIPISCWTSLFGFFPPHSCFFIFFVLLSRIIFWIDLPTDLLNFYFPLNVLFSYIYIAFCSCCMSALFFLETWRGQSAQFFLSDER